MFQKAFTQATRAVRFPFSDIYLNWWKRSAVFYILRNYYPNFRSQKRYGFCTIPRCFCFSTTPFFYKNSFYKNHQAQNCQKIKNILKIMARPKYMTKNLESPILILHRESAMYLTWFIVDVLWYLKRQYSITFLSCYVYFMIEIFLSVSLFPFFASCFALRQNAFTIPWDFLILYVMELGKI